MRTVARNRLTALVLGALAAALFLVTLASHWR